VREFMKMRARRSTDQRSFQTSLQPESPAAIELLLPWVTNGLGASAQFLDGRAVP
jgi:hypothetical protein